MDGIGRNMSNRFLFLLALLGLAAMASAEVRWGQVELAFFRVRGADGRMIDLPTQGVVIPVRMERIQAHSYKQPKPPAQNNIHFLAPAVSEVYKNDLGTNYFYDPGGPSALDDVNILPVGNNQWWYDLTLGVYTSTGNSAKIMNRQLGWTNYVQGLGHDVQAFSNLVFDVGWVFQPGQFPAGSWKYTINIHNYWSQIPDYNKPRVPNGLIYFAQEWRAYDLLGNGAFLTNQFSPVFSGDGDPQIGFSDDQYWNDWDPVDGIFAEDEVDYFGGPPNQANFLMDLTTQQGGVTDTVRPYQVSLFRGKANGGNIASLQFIDQNYYKALKGIVANGSEAPIQIIMDGFVSTTNLTALSADIVTKVSTPGLSQIVEMYNFVTNTWVQVDQRTAATSDTHLTIGAPGTASDYVDPTNGNDVRLKISYKQVGPVTQSLWGCSVDLGNWLATHP